MGSYQALECDNCHATVKIGEDGIGGHGWIHVQQFEAFHDHRAHPHGTFCTVSCAIEHLKQFMPDTINEEKR